MLDANTPVTIPGTDLVAYADLDSVDALWVCAGAPRFAVNSDGVPEVSLLLYRRGTGPADGGQLSLSVQLGLTPAEEQTAAAVVADRQRAAAAAAAAAAAEANAANGTGTGEPTGGEAPAAAAHRLVKKYPPGSPATPPPGTAAGPAHLPPAQLHPLSWVSTSVTVDLGGGVVLTGNGSLIGTNQASMAVQLDPHTAATVDKAWADGFPDATATALVVVDGATEAAAAQVTEAVAAPGAYQHTTVSTRIRSAVQLPLTLTGPLRLPVAARTSQRTDMAL